MQNHATLFVQILSSYFFEIWAAFLKGPIGKKPVEWGNATKETKHQCLVSLIRQALRAAPTPATDLHCAGSAKLEGKQIWDAFLRVPVLRLAFFFRVVFLPLVTAPRPQPDRVADRSYRTRPLTRPYRSEACRYPAISTFARPPLPAL